MCVLDMRGGFNQIKANNKLKHIIAMILPFGQYVPKVMFFGETNAQLVFQRFVDFAIGAMVKKSNTISMTLLYTGTEKMKSWIV